MSFNTSTRKDDVSLKLRSVNLHKARDETKQLEEESRKMEERLRELKMAMGREKEENDRGQSGFWNKGKQGSLTGYAQEVLMKPKLKTQKPKKVKVLKDEPVAPPVRVKVPGTLGFIAQRGTGNKENRIHGPRCGQCEQKAAQVSCLECGEEYCASCFAAFHLRGNLKKHRSVPVGTKVYRTPRGTITPRKPITESEKPKLQSNGKHVVFTENSISSSRVSSRTPTLPMQNGSENSLLDGDYNEVESAAAFQQALNEWRGDDSAATEQQVYDQPVSPVRSPVVSMEHGTSTDSELESKIPDITFHSSLSYAEKLMLKRHRRTELRPLPDDLGSRSETRSGSSEYGSPEQILSARTEVNGWESPEETLIQVLSEPVEDDDEGIHWQDIHRAMKSDSMIRSDSRSESRLSIIELDDDQPVKSRRRGRGVDVAHSSSYNVLEAGHEEDMEILSARKQSARSARKTRSDRKSGRTQNTENTRPRDDNSRRVSAKSDISASRPVSVRNETKINLTSDVNEKIPCPSSRPKSRTRPRSTRPKSSRADQNRPHSRAMSRAETRLALFGEGELTKTPSEALKEVSQMTPRHDSMPFLPTMSEFFTFGSDVTGEKVNTGVTKTFKSSGKEDGIAKWKVSYNLYNMGPRSWKPETSLKDQVGDSEAAKMVEEISEKLRTFLDPEDEEQLQEMETTSANEEAVGIDLTFTNRDDYTNRQWSRPISGGRHMSETSKPATPDRIRSRSVVSDRQMPKSLTSATPSRLMRELTNQSRAKSRQDTETTPRPESRAIVVDGDDLTSYDFEEKLVERDAEDEKSWSQLEWELASQDGRVTEDGKVSRLSMLTTPDEDELMALDQERGDTSLDMMHQDAGYLSPGASMDLRMNKLMEDFEEMEQKVNDEDDVKALAS